MVLISPWLGQIFLDLVPPNLSKVVRNFAFLVVGSTKSHPGCDGIHMSVCLSYS